MIEKVLTISIAAYNSEAYIRQALDSICDANVMDDIEVFVIDDGGKDRTLDIAREYENRYPQTFHAIHKENGGYGSTVNYSMQHATGKYFKLLDGDDWFDSIGLEKLVRFLRTCEADLVLSGRMEVDENNEAKHTSNQWEQLYGDIYCDKTVFLSQLKDPFVYGIWVTTYRSKILKEHPFQLPEHQLYTDRMFICYPLPWISSVAFQNYDVYCYRFGHEGQSVSITNRIKHFDMAINGYRLLLDFYENNKDIPQANRNFLNLRMARYFNNVIQTVLLLPASPKNRKLIQTMDMDIKAVSEELYQCCGQHNSMLLKFRKYTYLLYWIRKLKTVKNWA